MKNKKVFGIVVLALIVVIAGAANCILSMLSARVDLNTRVGCHFLLQCIKVKSEK